MSSRAEEFLYSDRPTLRRQTDYPLKKASPILFPSQPTMHRSIVERVGNLSRKDPAWSQISRTRGFISRPCWGANRGKSDPTADPVWRSRNPTVAAIAGFASQAICPKMSRAVPTLAQVYEDHAADFTRAAEQTDDPVFRNMLLTLALQWRLAAREEAATRPIQPKMADGAC